MKIKLRSKNGLIILHVLIWSALQSTPYLAGSTRNGYGVEGIPANFFAIIGLVNILIFYTHALLLFPKFFNRRWWWLYLLLNTALIAFSFQLKWRLLDFWYHTIISQESSYKFIFPSSIVFYFFSLIYSLIVHRLQTDREQKERQAAQLQTELKFLRSQISPHFLFNVLTNLVSLARKRSDKLEPALIKLSELLRYMLYDTQGKKVSLQTEIEYLKNYLDLQELRFGSDVDVDSRIDAGEAALSYSIEPMLLIPFVENAFKHGVGYRGRPAIGLSLTVIDGILNFEVQNSFDPEPPVLLIELTPAGARWRNHLTPPGAAAPNAPEESSGIGLGNVRSRLKLLYPNKYHLQLSNNNSIFHIRLSLELI